MSRRFVLLLILTAAFMTISTIAVYEHGYLALWRLPFETSGTLQLFSDLTVSILLVTSWMVRDSRTSGVPVLPYLLVTLASGSLGPLLYLLHRESRTRRGAIIGFHEGGRGSVR